MTKRAINPARLAEGCVALVLGLGLLWLAVTKNYQHYVTPRTMPYLYFAAAALVVMAVYNFSKLFEVTHIRNYTQMLALLIPLVLLGSSTYVEQLWDAPLFPAGNAALESPTLLDETYTMTATGYEGRVLHGYDPEHQTLTVMEDETYFWLTEIYTDATPFLGFEITTMGQVLKDEKYFPEGDTFSPIRKLMTCCVADLFSIGFKCQYDDVAGLTADEWVTITGKLQMVDLEEYQEMRIVVDSVTPCSPPDEPYVYAY